MSAWWYQVVSGPVPACALVVVFTCFYGRFALSSRLDRDDRERALRAAMARAQARQDRREEAARSESRREEAMAARALGFLSADEARAAVPPLAASPWCPSLAQRPLDDKQLDTRQQEGVQSRSMSGTGSTSTVHHNGTAPDLGLEGNSARMRDLYGGPEAEAELQRRLGMPADRAARVAAAGRAGLLAKEEAEAAYMTGDPKTCLHLSAVDVTLLDKVTVVGRLCPACGTALPLKEES